MKANELSHPVIGMIGGAAVGIVLLAYVFITFTFTDCHLSQGGSVFIQNLKDCSSSQETNIKYISYFYFPLLLFMILVVIGAAAIASVLPKAIAGAFLWITLALYVIVAGTLYPALMGLILGLLVKLFNHIVDLFKKKKNQ